MTEWKTMAGKALVAFELICFSWLFVVYGRDLFHGGRELLTIKRADAREVKENDPCERSVSDFVLQETVNGLDSSMMISLHRNGEVDACGSATVAMKALDDAMRAFKGRSCPKPNQKLDKYIVESLLTEFFWQSMSDNQCESTDTKKNKDLEGFRGFCDMGRDRTVPQPDSVRLVEGPAGNLPCRFFTREGVRISSMQQLAELLIQRSSMSIDKGGDASPSSCTNENSTDGDTSETCSSNDPTLDLYAVPAGRVFMFAPKYVGEMFELPHVLDQSGSPLALEVLSLNPRVFDIHNFFSENEAQQLIDKALAETTETHKLHRSTTGTVGANIFQRRTSENAWDTHGKVAQTIKRWVAVTGMSILDQTTLERINSCTSLV